MSGTPPTAALLAAGDIDLPGTPPQGVVPQSQAVGYLMHSPRGLPGLPSMGIKIWPICKEESMWIVRAPTLSRPGETEQVPAFLLEPVYKLCGPFAAHRRASVDQARDVVAETGRLFVAFAEQYVAALADHQDPGAASTWEVRPLVPVDVQQGSTADRGDADPPDLLDLQLEVGHVDGSPELGTVTITARIVDELSGIGHGNGSSPSQARLNSPSSQIRDALFTPSTRVSGDDHDGVYSQVVELGEHAERGRWSLSYLMVVDNAGNHRHLQPADLTAAGFSTSVPGRVALDEARRLLAGVGADQKGDALVSQVATWRPSRR